MQKATPAGQAKVATQRPARAATVAAAKNVRHDELHEYERRVDIVVSMLVLNVEARSLDDSTPQGSERDPNRGARFAMASVIASQTGTLRAMGWSLGKNCTLWLAYHAPKTVF